MTPYVLLPVHNYLSGAARLLGFVRATLADAPVMVYNDGSDARYAPMWPRFEAMGCTLRRGRGGDLRLSLLAAAKSAQAGGHEAVLCCETDAIPFVSTLDAMLRLWEMRTDKVASVSPIYTWQGEPCYPTNPHWLREGRGDCQNIREVDGIGRVANAHAVPFLFSLWRPECLLQINGAMPPLVSLDGTLGVHLSDAGWEHWRLLDHAVEHEFGGFQSRGAASQKKMGFWEDYERAESYLSSATKVLW